MKPIKPLESIIDRVEELFKKTEHDIEMSYNLIKDDFGKTIIYKGKEWIITGLRIHNDTIQESEYKLTSISTMMIEIKCSFFESKEISLEDYLKWKHNRMF